MTSDESSFQTHKIYVQNLSEAVETDLLEKTLKNMFSDFGEIVDLKILVNSRFISPQETLRVHFFSRGRIRAFRAQLICNPRR